MQKIGDPHIVPQIVGSLLQGPKNKVPLLWERLNSSLDGATRLLEAVSKSPPVPGVSKFTSSPQKGQQGYYRV